jgi:hypothetical protein
VVSCCRRRNAPLNFHDRDKLTMRPILLFLLFLAIVAGAESWAAETTALPRPVVEVEEDVYSYAPADILGIKQR